MSVFFRTKPKPAAEVEQRGTFPAAQLQQLMGLFRQDFQNVDLSRADQSLQSVAVRSAVDLLASMASELPVDVFRGEGSSRQQLPMPAWLEDPDGSGQGLADWCYRVMVSWLLRGNLYGDVLERGPGNTLRQVDLFHPDEVHPQMENGVVQWFVHGRQVPRMLHRRVNPVPGWILGLSPIQYHVWTISQSLAATRFGMQWFQDGAHPTGILRNTETTLKDEQARGAKDAFMAALRGTREPVVFGKGWEWTQLQINPEESQFLETQGFSAAECARMFGPGLAEILGYATEGGSLTYSTLIDRDLHVLKYAANKWLLRLERLLSEFLPRPQYVRLKRDAFLQTDTLRRYQAYSTGLDKRFLTVNEVRDLEDMPRVDWGDDPNATPGAAAGPADDEPDEQPQGEETD